MNWQATFPKHLGKPVKDQAQVVFAYKRPDGARFELCTILTQDQIKRIYAITEEIQIDRS